MSMQPSATSDTLTLLQNMGRFSDLPRPQTKWHGPFLVQASAAIGRSLDRSTAILLLFLLAPVLALTGLLLRILPLEADEISNLKL